ncbi:MAG: PEP-CTERM sorting domain-containing protein [Pseudomonadota bacterium]
MKVIPKLILVGLILSGGLAHAAIVQYQDSSLFHAATTGGVMETFEGYAAPASFVDVANQTVGNITYPDYGFIVDSAFSGGGYDWGSGAVLILNQSATDTLSFAPTTAFSASFGTALPFAENITVTIDGNSFLIGTTNFPNLSFYGWISDTPFSSISFSAGGGAFPILDNIFMARASTEVPEPASLAIFGLGLLGLLSVAAARRRPLAAGGMGR